MAEAVRPKKKKKTRPQKKTEEPASSTFSPTIRAESLSDELSAKQEERLVDVIKDVDSRNPTSETRDLNISKGQDESSIKEGEEITPEARKIEVDNGENQPLKEDDAVKEMGPVSDSGVGDDSESIGQSDVILLDSQELLKDEVTNESVPMDGEHIKNEEEHTTHDAEHQEEGEYDKLPKSDVFKDSQVLYAESTQAGAEAGAEAGADAGAEAGTEAGTEAGAEAGADAGAEAGDTQTVASTSDSHVGEYIGINIHQEGFQSEDCVEQNSELELASLVSPGTEQSRVDGSSLQTAVLSDLPVNESSEILADKEDVKDDNESSLGQKEKVVSGYFSSRVANILANDSVAESSIESSIPIIDIHQETLSPFTEEQLRTFYFNQELNEVPVFIDQFLQNINRESHELYDLLNTYYKCRIALVGVLDKIKASKKEISLCTEKVWITHNLTVVSKGQCKDKCSLQDEIKYSSAEFIESEAESLRRLLKGIRDHIHEELQLKSYNCQLARIRIECYIHEMLKGSALLRGISTENPLSVKLPRDLMQDDIMGLHALQDAITILFSFKRMGNVEGEFSKDIDIWLSTLVSILQRAGALPDYFFILNHVLRCPPGSIEGLARNIQFPDFYSIHCESIWNSPLVHHFVVMLATIALPIKERSKLLMRYKHEMKPTMERTMSWTLVDENREEDENPEHSWYLLLENDLVSLFEQFPFEGLFRYLLRLEKIEGNFCYSATHSTSNDIVHLLAFTSCIVQILGKIFDTYNLLRYRQFAKRISRTIRWVVQIVSDHWCSYRSWRIEVCGDSDKDTPNFLTVTTQFSLERLQLEFDNFFTKATSQILNSQSVGALQFLASMPFDAISTNAAWSLLNRLISTSTDSTDDQSKSARLKSIIGDVPSPEELIFLFTALSNMAISRSKDDREFINCVAIHLLEFAFSDVGDSLRTDRECRDMIAAISATHQFVMSTVIARISKLKEDLLNDCLYLLNSLPLELWHPEAEDLEQLRSWLLGHPLNSIQHQLARLIISKINFDTKQETGVLFLPRKFHFAMAVMLVEVYGSCIPDGPGGLKNLEYENAGILSQVSSLAYQSLNKILYSQAQDEFLRWCQDILLSLKLHLNDVENDERNEDDSSILLSIEESQRQQQGHGSWANAVLSSFENFCPDKTVLDHCPELLNVKRALSTDGTLACYVSLMMSQLGHSPDVFLSKGIVVISKILESGWVNAVFRVISDILPLLHTCLDLLEKNPGFLQIIDALVHLDASKAGYSEKILPNPEPGLYSQMLSSVIITTVTSTAKRFPDRVRVMTSCWFKLLVQKSTWYKDTSVLFLLDQLCKVVYITEGSFQVIVDHLYQKHQALIDSQSNRGLLSSMMSWISPVLPITLLEIKKQPEFAYFAYVVLLVEKAFEEKLGIWQKMTSKMALKQHLQADAAYKKAASRTKASYVPPFQHLNIYRWAEQGLSTSTGHPLLPLIWQQFFLLYLQKQNTAEGLPSRVGVGYRFLDSTIQAGLAKKIRSHLSSAASYHKQKSLAKEDDRGADESASPSNIKSHIHDETVHITLTNLYQAMALWIEESRLHDPNLFLDALPDVYKSGDLTKIFQGDQEPWLQYVDKSCIEREIESLGSLWTMTLNRSWKSKLISREDSQHTRPMASQRVLKRLKKEFKPKAPQPVEVSNSPIPEVSMQLLLSRPRLIQDLNDDLERMLRFAKTSCMNFDEHVALDGEYMEILPDLYTNILKHIIKQIPCNRGKQPCTGPAKIIFRYKEKEVKERNLRRLEENRNAWESNVNSFVQPLPHNLCIGAVYVESVISTLMKSVQYANPAQKTDLENAGVRLFYLFAELINGDVKRNSPAIQFFSSGTEILGKELIATNEAEQERLVKTILAEEASVGFLAPHFNPSPQFRSFLHLYSTTTSLFAESRLTALFVLVSKFDLRTWLSLGPSVSETTFMVRTIITVMEKFGKEPSEDVGMLFGLFRSHLELVLRYRFPQQLNQVLTLLFQTCQKGTLPFVCLQDFLAIIGCKSNQNISPASAPCQVDANEAYQAITWMSEFFSELHKTFYYSNSKLYTAWKVYLPYIASLLPFLFAKLLNPYSTDEISSIEKDRFFGKTWNDIFTIYRPWIVPHQADGSWPTLYVEDSLLLIQSFTESARLISDLCIYNNIFSFGLNMVWAFYCSEVASCLRQDNALEIYHGLLMTLPWASFSPSLQDLNRMLELYVRNWPAFHFLGSIVCTLAWPSILSQQRNYGASAHITEYLIAILRITVMLSINPPFLAKTFSQFEQLIESEKTFPWHIVDAQNATSVCYWFAENCDPIFLFEDNNHTMIVMHLLKIVCCMAEGSRDVQPTAENVNEAFSKQNVYVGMLSTIITRAASKHKISLKKLDGVVSSLLVDIEQVTRISSNQESIELYSSVLMLLNSVTEGPVLQCIEYRIQNFFSETNDVSAVLTILSAAGRVLAGLDQLLTLSEAAIECFFNRIPDIDFNESWTRILEVFLVPELNQEQFVLKALSRCCFLTLYAYNLHRISLCRDDMEKFTILRDAFLWCTQGVPSPALCEKYLMIWWQILQLVRRLLSVSKSNSNANQIRQYLSKFASYCQQIGEDKTYSGILGAIGVGKKSQFPKHFRLVARSLHTFIAAQLPNASTKLRSYPDAPGGVKAKKSEAPNQEAQAALQELSNLKKNKHYILLKDDITWIYDFISNPKKCILDGPELLAYFCRQYYFKVSYIAATIRLEGA